MDDLICIGEIKIPTELAITSDEQSLGLMFQKTPKVMAFVYTEPRYNRFWMKATPLPLDIVFCRENKVVAICKGEPHSTSLVGPEEPSDLVIEFPYGTSNQLQLKVGDHIKMQYSKNSLSKILLHNSQ